MTDYSNIGTLVSNAANAVTQASRQQQAAARRTEINRIRARARAGRTPQQQHEHEQLTREQCPAAPRLTHWIPPGFDHCVRNCGITL